MRVAFDGRSLASPVLRGWDRYTVGLVGELVRQGVEVTLFHREREALHPPHISGLGCKVLGLPDYGGMYWEQIAVPLALRHGKFDLFHAPAEHGVPFAAPCPVLLTIHSVTIDSYRELIQRGMLKGSLYEYLGHDVRLSKWSFAACYQRAQIARADHIFTPSEFCREEVIKFLGVPAERVTTTYLAVHEQFQKPRKPEVEREAVLNRLGIRKPYLLYVGGYEPHKNVNGLLEMFAVVKKHLTQLSLVLVGSKSLPDSTVQKAAHLGLESGREVIFLLNVTDELTDIYDDAELLVTLSWRETFCLPALEAMTRGVPVVASAWGATSEIINGAGRLVDPRDHVAASHAVIEQLAKTARSLAKAEALAQARRFSWEQAAMQTLLIYKRLSGSPVIQDLN